MGLTRSNALLTCAAQGSHVMPVKPDDSTHCSEAAAPADSQLADVRATLVGKRLTHRDIAVQFDRLGRSEARDRALSAVDFRVMIPV